MLSNYPVQQSSRIVFLVCCAEDFECVSVSVLTGQECLLG
jgi:hypothetical protein